MSEDDLHQVECDMWGAPPAEKRWVPGDPPMTLERAADVLSDCDVTPEERAEAARVANEARAQWSFAVPISDRPDDEVHICSLCGLDLSEDDVDDCASAHSQCLLNDVELTIEAWEPVVRAAVELGACYQGEPGWTPEDNGAGERLTKLLESVRVLQSSQRALRSPESKGGQS